MASVLEVTDLIVRYPAQPNPIVAVSGVSFTEHAGRVLTLLGPNGAGKTSTVETLEGYRRPSDGSVRVLGLDPIADARQLAPRIGVMLQRNGVYVTMNARDTIRLFASYYGDRAQNPDALLERVGLRSVATTPWRRLSGGEQQRLSLALAIVGRPEVAFFDEPTAGVDPMARLVVRDIIRELRDAGVCVVLTTHDLDEAERLSDRILIIDHGKVIADGSPSELMSGGPRAAIRFGGPPDLDQPALAAHMGAAVESTQPGEYAVACEPSPANVAALTAWLATHNHSLADLRAGRQSLEDVFLRLTESAKETDASLTTTGRRPRRAPGRKAS
jgi:ABC-2 type transport system ATP-binding protein